LATSLLEEDYYTRQYPYGEVFSHTVGYTEYGKSGIEAKYHFALENLSNELYQRTRNVLFKTELKADSIVLGLDAELQEMIYKELNDKKAGVVVMEPTTGKILSMVSLPTFDPNNLFESWGMLKNDENSPLINRTTQGLYPPGSVFKIVTSLSGIQNLYDYTSHSFNCLGELEFSNSNIRCFNLKSHGWIDMNNALAYSCNTYYSTLGLDVGQLNLKNTSEKFYFNKDYKFELEHVQSLFSLDESSNESEIIETAIGQGKTLVTPLHMAMITSSVANGGIMMQPYIVDYSISNNGIKKNKQVPKSIDRIMSFHESEVITNMMTSVVDIGTAKNIDIDGVSVAAKTGTAENAHGDDHGWFIAFAPSENPQVVVSILFENSDGPKQAIELAKKILEFTLNP
jgi:penicillin-binding protein A